MMSFTTFGYFYTGPAPDDAANRPDAPSNVSTAIVASTGRGPDPDTIQHLQPGAQKRVESNRIDQGK